MPRSSKHPLSLQQQVQARLPGLESYLKAGAEFHAAVPRMAAALACCDRPVTLAEFLVMSELIRQCENSPLVAVAMMDAVRSGLKLDAAAAALQTAAVDVPEATRRAAWTMLWPLVMLQGDKARTVASELADALGLEVTRSELQSLPPPSSTGQRIIELIKQLANRDRDLLLKVREVADATGDSALQTALESYLHDASAERDVRDCANRTLQTLDTVLGPAHEAVANRRELQVATEQALQMAENLKSQVLQRMEVLEARLHHERRALAEDILETVHDAGESLELSLVDRMRTDDPSDSRAWESAARQTFGKDMERRIDRMVRRREDILRLLRDELRAFQGSAQLTRSSRSLMAHHAQLARLMPSMRLSTRALHTADTLANFGLTASVLSAAGSGAAIYVMGAPLLVPILAPVAPVIGGVAVVSFLFKWLTNKQHWTADEIRHKRTAFEEQLRERLDLQSEWFLGELTRLEEAFVDTACAMLQPVLLDAQAAARVVQVQQEILDDVTTRCRKAQLLIPDPVAAGSAASPPN